MNKRPKVDRDSRARERRMLLHQLFECLEGHDAAEQVRRLKEQDEGF